MSEPASIPVAILARVSSDRQSTDRQVSDLTTYAKGQKWNLVATITAVVSGSKVRYANREDMQQVRALVESGKIQKLLVHEVSRIGRSPVETLQLVEFCHEHGVSVFDFAMKQETLTPEGRPTLQANVILPLLAGLARNENEQRRERIMSGLEEARRKKVKLGRPTGSGLEPGALLAKHKDVVKHLKSGQSIRHTAAITCHSVSTVLRIKKAMEA